MIPSEHATKSSTFELYELIGGFSGFLYFILIIIFAVVVIKMLTQYLRSLELKKIAAGIDLAFLYVTIACLLAGFVTGIIVIVCLGFIRRYHKTLLDELKGREAQPI